MGGGESDTNEGGSRDSRTEIGCGPPERKKESPGKLASDPA